MTEAAARPTEEIVVRDVFGIDNDREASASLPDLGSPQALGRVGRQVDRAHLLFSPNRNTARTRSARVFTSMFDPDLLAVFVFFAKAKHRSP